MIEPIESPVASVMPIPVEDVVSTKRQRSTGAFDTHLPKPLLRGWIHAIAAILTLLLAMTLVIRDAAPTQWFPLAVFGVSLVELYSASAAFHLMRWHGKLYACMRLLDHCSIFVMIAATATIFTSLVPLFGVRIAFTILIWISAAVGIALKVIHPRMSRILSTVLYVGMGWLAGGAWLLLWLVQRPAIAGVALLPLALAGALYTLGALIYARRDPDWWPTVFGYHELFHVLVVLANTAIAIAILHIVGVPFIV